MADRPAGYLIGYEALNRLFDRLEDMEDLYWMYQGMAEYKAGEGRPFEEFVAELERSTLYFLAEFFANATRRLSSPLTLDVVFTEYLPGQPVIEGVRFVNPLAPEFDLDAWIE